MTDEDRQAEEDRKVYAEAMQEEPLPISEWDRYRIGRGIAKSVKAPPPDEDDGA
jgi:hypothetical protein